MASVVRMFLPIEAAFCSRAGDHGRVDDAVGDQVAVVASRRVQALAGLQPADLLDHDRALEARVLGDLPDRLLERALDDRRPCARHRPCTCRGRSRPGRSAARRRLPERCPPRAPRTACKASSTRCFFSFISVSVAAPTLTTATPPASFASRSCSFSRSKSESVSSTSVLICLMRPRSPRIRHRRR